MRNARLAAACIAALVASGAVNAATGSGIDDRAITVQGRPVLIDVTANDAGLGTLRGIKIQSRPRHGSVGVQAGQVRYMPAAGFTGRDSFRYIAVGSTGTGSAVVTVEVGTPLTLQGRVVDSPIADAQVTASVAGYTFSTQADANGDYSLELVSLGAGMVSIDARGVGAQSFVRLLSVVGDIDRLADEADADGVLTRDENNQVQVTNLSTAQARLLQAANGGAPIASDEQLIIAQESLDHTQLLQQAAALRLAVDGGYPLPAGTTDTLALISNPAALAQFIASVNSNDPAALSSTMTAIASDPAIVVPVSASDLLGTYALIFDLGRPGALNMSYVQGNQLTLAAGGTGSFVTGLSNPEPSVSWTFAPPVANVVPNTPYSFTFFPFVNGVQRRASSTQVDYQVAKVFEGTGRDTLAYTTTSYISYPDNPELQPYFQTSSTTLTGIRDEGGSDPLTNADVVGTRSIWIPETYAALPPDITGGGAEHFTFFANNTGQRAGGASFTWNIDALGRLAISFGGDSALFRRIATDGRAGAGFFGEWRTGGVRTARYMMSATRDGFAFTAANGERSWRSGFYLGQSTIQPGTDFTFTLDPAGVAWRRSASATQTSVVPVGWRIVNSSVEILDYRDGSGQPVHSCQVGVNGCRIAMIRRWRPTAVDGDRVYVIEELLQERNGNGNPQLTSQRVNYYDAIARPQLGQKHETNATQSKPRTRSLR
jgi:hypothetical protein